MRILVTGQCTVHWGRLEYGNIGNYYITETSFRELHRVFPDAEIVTTFQMTDEFCKRERVSCLPMELFYSWSDKDLDISLKELGIATIYNKTGKLVDTTPYIEEVLKSDLIIDFSGEMWGDHADMVGKNRFIVGLIKDNVAQLFGKKIVMLAGTQGTFSDESTVGFAKIVFNKFDLVANREGKTTDILRKYGFDIENVKTFACPAFLFQPEVDSKMESIYKRENIIDRNKKTVGFVLCGFTFLEGPYDKWPRRDEEYVQFAEVIEYIANELGGRVILMSHSNGFNLPPNFKLINGRDYPIVKQLQNVVQKRGLVDMDNVLCIDRPYRPQEVKSIIGKFDMFITGRLHASVAALSQNVPTVTIMHGNGPDSYKIIGFAEIVGTEEYVAYPDSSDNIKKKVRKCWDNMDEVRNHLKCRIPKVQEIARASFTEIKKIIDS
ncbi:MAG: polysaccharide pyruvyl transferase family protein [Paludibacter sp.]|nr:polysaccharide pyruvyl transferase family protein [Paludibacter sp.]MDD4429638.1 polysaccharide pyruvyl transferase family protein [Paludibacter sp.]